jgi:two-component system, LytTR family, sensor kinase
MFKSRHNTLRFLKKLIPHIFFWTFLWCLFIYLDYSPGNFLKVAWTELIHIVFYIVLIYINLYLLIPLYLSKERFGIYTLFLSGIVLMGSILKVLVLYVRFINYPEIQIKLLDNQTWIFISNFLITSGSTLFKITSDWLLHQNEKRELERRSMQSELRFLKSQINPHFLFNTLNNLYALTLKKSDQAPDIVLKLSDMMRYMLYECNEKFVLLEKEIFYLQNYIELERLRLDRSVNIVLKLEGETGKHLIAPLILIPFVENAFKHGLKSSFHENAYFYCNLSINNNQLKFVVINSKPIHHTNEKDRFGGIGLVNVQRRLNILYPNKYDLKIKNTKEEYQVYLDLELNDL